jgi:hypothetical protein
MGKPAAKLAGEALTEIGDSRANEHLPELTQARITTLA